MAKISSNDPVLVSFVVGDAEYLHSFALKRGLPVPWKPARDADPGAWVPVSLVGTLAVYGVLGFSINLLTLFGLVLAIGLVVDDAIIWDIDFGMGCEPLRGGE